MAPLALSSPIIMEYRPGCPIMPSKISPQKEEALGGIYPT